MNTDTPEDALIERVRDALTEFYAIDDIEIVTAEHWPFDPQAEADKLESFHRAGLAKYGAGWSGPSAETVQKWVAETRATPADPDRWLVTVAFWDGSLELEIELHCDASFETIATAISKEIEGHCDAAAHCRAEQQAERRAMCI